MAFNPIIIDKENLTFCGVIFPDLDTLKKTANAIGLKKTEMKELENRSR